MKKVVAAMSPSINDESYIEQVDDIRAKMDEFNRLADNFDSLVDVFYTTRFSNSDIWNFQDELDVSIGRLKEFLNQYLQYIV